MTYVIDFETRSKADIKETGAWMYAKHPSTIAICLAFGRVDSDRTPDIWTYQDDLYSAEVILEPLFEAVRNGELIEGHNVFFERCIWREYCVPVLGWPPVDDNQWRCTAARCAAAGLPRSLDAAGKVLDLPVKKDKDGHRVMLKVSRPRKPTKHDKSVWHEKQDDLDKTYEYCKIDVVVEKLVSRIVPELSDAEFRVWQLDQIMNERGVAIDIPAVEAAVKMLGEAKAKADSRAEEITGGVVTALTQRQRLVDWVQERGYPSNSLAKDTLQGILDADPAIVSNRLQPNVREILELKLSVAKSSTAKYQRMLDRTDKDGRTRDTLIYQGANRTGRWSGTGIQFQNLPRGEENDNLETLVEQIKFGDSEMLEMIFGSTHSACASAIRSMVIAGEGNRLIVCDFAAIEARVLAWLATNLRMLKLFHDGVDVYKDLAVDIYDVKGGIENVTKDQRFVGKTAVLGLGYQMGVGKFLGTMESYKFPISEELASLCVETFRERNPEYVKYWRRLESAAIKAVKNPGECHGVYPIVFERIKNVLYVKLPSGRSLHYIRPKVRMIDKWGNGRLSEQLTYWGTNQTTRKWERQDTYGGKLTENITQAVARDLMAESMLALEAADYPNILTIHDEAVLDVPKGFGSLEDVQRIMRTPPKWAKGCPIGAEGFEAERYRKD